MNLHYRRPRRKPLLRRRHRVARLTYAKYWKNEYEKHGSKAFYHILWTDETKINQRCPDVIQKVLRRPNEEYHPKCILPTVKYDGGSVKLWGSMSAKGVRTLHVISGIMDSDVYIDILKQNVKASRTKLGLTRKFLFQQDGDPKHTSKKTINYIEKNIKKYIKNWPAQSPDLNPIKHIWWILQKAVEARKPKSLKECEQFCHEEWEKIDPSVCANLIETYHHRLDAVIKANGGHTKY